MSDCEFAERVGAVRGFNRFYTRVIGLLDETLLDGGFSLSETRALYEIGHRPSATAGEIARDLGLDAGYLSRILRRFDASGLIQRSPSPSDARQSLLALTEAGRATLLPLEQRSQEEIALLLRGLAESDQKRLVGAMRRIEAWLGRNRPNRENEALLLRPPRPGDIGWVVERHGALYAEEYGFDARFEALVAEIAAAFLRNYDPKCDCCWIAERQSERVGSAFVTRADATTAKLRLVLVEPHARGLGIGRRLVAECVRFAREHGYAELRLWTNDILLDARRLYERTGFRLVASEPHDNFGPPIIGETWTLDLRRASHA